MTIVKSRETANKAKKHQPILFGRKLLQLHVGPRQNPFSVHEDMLCMRSTDFKDRFQKKRKVIEGECVICHGDLDILKNLSPTAKNAATTCMSTDETPLIRSADLDEVNADGFHVYAQWLYGRNIPTFAADKEGVWLRIIKLVKAHAVGEISNDMEFVQVVRKEIVKCSQEIGYVPTAAIQKA